MSKTFVVVALLLTASCGLLSLLLLQDGALAADPLPCEQTQDQWISDMAAPEERAVACYRTSTLVGRECDVILQGVHRYRLTCTTDGRMLVEPLDREER